MPNLCIIFIQLIEGANLEEQYGISVLLFDLPVLLLRVCEKTCINGFLCISGTEANAGSCSKSSDIGDALTPWSTAFDAHCLS